MMLEEKFLSIVGVGDYVIFFVLLFIYNSRQIIIFFDYYYICSKYSFIAVSTSHYIFNSWDINYKYKYIILLKNSLSKVKMSSF